MNNQKPTILLAEDDNNLGSVLKEYLELKNYTVTLCRDGAAAWATFRQAVPDGGFDLCLLDIMMPKQDGFTLAKNIRNINSHIPIIFLTAKSMKEDKIEGFKIGGDDYITKPFSMEELLMRIKAVMRRVNKAKENEMEETVFKIGKYSFDFNKQILQIKNKTEKLSTKEAELLRMLCLHKNEVLKRDEALMNIWGSDDYFKGRSMDVFITKLRKYLNEDTKVEILNVHGTGYKLLVD